MRLWTIHPKYLDCKGLVAAWREALLAQKVLAGGTRGYTKHPQLIRFREHRDPVSAIATFLVPIAQEAEVRGYKFDATKINESRIDDKIEETDGQLMYEWQHLLAKLKKRDIERYKQFCSISTPDVSPVFTVVPGEIRSWEKTEPPSKSKSKRESGKDKSSDMESLAAVATENNEISQQPSSSKDRITKRELASLLSDGVHVVVTGSRRRSSASETPQVQHHPKRVRNVDENKKSLVDKNAVQRKKPRTESQPNDLPQLHANQSSKSSRKRTKSVLPQAKLPAAAGNERNPRVSRSRARKNV